MKIEYKGCDTYLSMLQKMEDSGSKVCGKALYAGAKVVADAIKSNLQGLGTVDNAYNLKAYKGGYKSKLSAAQKQGLIDGFGIAKAETKNGMRNVKVGFEGYNSVKTKKYPNGQPNPLIARVVEGGSDYFDKTPFVKPAVQKSKQAAIEAMQKVIEEEFKQFTKG